MESELVLLRHGQSEWNLENRFSGWTDVDLTPQGVLEAERSARLLHEQGFRFDAAFTSVLKRAIRTLWIVLDELDQMWLPVIKDWRLNERHYGALQGHSKDRMAQQVGEETVFSWRRGYQVRPPALPPDDPRHPRFDPRYQSIDPDRLPVTESLHDTLLRVLPCWQDSIVPRLKNGERVL
ncbi:MAG TPA: 2,3-bisphosphoglycerate-dependent phosphoglycerate mutase, partial [Anaerolineaceae bacterium]|nr:2,3-bisphosphoglycerate-dependent phosphoglycerate mutase [Anaerolineaceae bacterium]